MSVVVDVALISGRRVASEADLDASVESLKRRAQKALGVGTGRLLNSWRQFVWRCDACDNWVANRRLPHPSDLVQICGGCKTFCFAAVLGDRSVVTWGNAACGGDSRGAQDQLKNVQQIQASRGAFAAILVDGSVVTWGNAVNGGDSSAVQDQLKNVQQIQAATSAFVAIRSDGSVDAWGQCSLWWRQ